MTWEKCATKKNTAVAAAAIEARFPSGRFDSLGPLSFLFLLLDLFLLVLLLNLNCPGFFFISLVFFILRIDPGATGYLGDSFFFAAPNPHLLLELISK